MKVAHKMRFFWRDKRVTQYSGIIMKSNLTDALCIGCGLCCDGSLFADAELASRETTALEVLGLEIEDADPGEPALLLQPCAAFKGKRCTIYLHRPGCCRTFECRLLTQVESGAVSVDRAKEKIAHVLREIGRVKVLMAQLGQRDERLPLKERFSEALTLSSEKGDDPRMNRKHADLQTAITRVQKLLQQTFLSG
jgi:Fe-S-cluster containining protein